MIAKYPVDRAFLKVRVRFVFLGGEKMKVANSASSRVGVYTTLAAQNGEIKGKLARNAATDAAKSDSITVSHDGKLLNLARAEAINAPEVRSEKIAALKSRLDDGSYQPDSKRIAMALVREEPGLFRL